MMAIIKIMRPVNFLITFASVIVAALICIQGSFETLNILSAALSASFVTSAGNIINDYFDIEIDRINRPNRVLPSGLLTKRTALTIYLSLLFVSIVLAALVSISSVFIVAVSNCAIFLYSYKLKRIPLAGNFIVSFFTGLVFIYGGLAVNNWIYGIIPAVFAFLTNFIREIIKDIEDIDGDMANNIFTFPSLKGIDKSIDLITILTILLILLTTIPFLLKIYSIEYFVVVMPVVNSIFVYVVGSLRNNQSKKNAGRMSRLVKLNMVLGLIAIYLGN
ncbi:MAG: hypothetical protein CVV23_15235 [Ignavibacteriae bacterium HGW-Ignavibacteriae-2]|jgi:geranylgeranylglycerol-phosphate geranylgeranyltransferase|nr:MAG: hypothetical protein CVV23_15235 [Ignavibacteriae bacterium HGW-Ignavibacteriae-2]